MYRKGFSLIELIVVLGLMGTIVLALSAVMLHLKTCRIQAEKGNSILQTEMGLVHLRQEVHRSKSADLDTENRTLTLFSDDETVTWSIGSDTLRRYSAGQGRETVYPLPRNCRFMIDLDQKGIRITRSPSDRTIFFGSFGDHP